MKLNNISKRYNKEQALHPFSCELNPGETIVVIGQSGSGKSTLLRLVTGLLRSDTGKIFIDEVQLTDQSLPALRLKLGYVIQEGGLFPHLDAESNISIMARHLGWEEDRIKSRLAELLELVQLPADVLPRYPTELSGGQRQRVSLVRALMLDPGLLIMDEPLGALDPMIRYDLQNDLKDIFTRLGKSVLLVTHDINEAAFFADQIVVLHEGRVVQQGTLSDLLHRPVDDFVTQFIRAQRQHIEADGNLQS